MGGSVQIRRISQLPWRRPDATVLQPSAWLGEDAQTLIDKGEYKKVWRRLVRWQECIGKPGDAVSKKLQRKLGSPVAPPELALVRQKLADTLVPVERAYLLNTQFKLSWHWSDISTWKAQNLWRSLRDAHRYARQRGFALDADVYPPSGFIIGFSGSARMTARGNAWQLQDFVKNFCTYRIFMGINSSNTKTMAFMRPIPWYMHCHEEKGYLRVGSKALHPKLVSFEEEMASLQQRLDRLTQRRNRPHHRPGPDQLGAA